MSAAAFRGTFSDFKLIRGRKIAQVVIEVPLEQADAALQALGGLPNPAGERWVAVARLNSEGRQEQPADQKERRRFHEMPAASQIAMACQTDTFREYVRLMHCAGLPDDAAACDAWVKDLLEVGSKRDVIPGSKAFEEWTELYGNYSTWLKYERSAA